jgi:hypothetical protein
LFRVLNINVPKTTKGSIFEKNKKLSTERKMMMHCGCNPEFLEMRSTPLIDGEHCDIAALNLIEDN